jgi:hypothetical protein
VIDVGAELVFDGEPGGPVDVGPYEAEDRLGVEGDASLVDERAHCRAHACFRGAAGRVRFFVFRQLADVRAEDEAEGSRVLEREPHVADTEADELLPSASSARLAFRHARVERAEAFAGGGGEERGLVAKVVVRRRLAHAGGGGDAA